METKHLIVEEVSCTDLQMFCDVPSSCVCWKVMQKENDELIGYASFKEIEKSVIEINGFDVAMHENELMESLLNHVFYRLNARKVLFSCISNDVMRKNVIEHFGFHKESFQEIDNENEETFCVECYSLYKEEYIGWLRKRGKTLGFLRVKELRVVFLVVAAVGVILFGMDLFRKVNTLQTAFYAYLTGIGTAGAFACSWMSAKKKQEDEHHAG